MGGHDQGALYPLRRHLLQGTGHIRDRDPPVPQPRPDQTAGVGPEEGQLRGGGAPDILLLEKLRRSGGDGAFIKLLEGEVQ